MEAGEEAAVGDIGAKEEDDDERAFEEPTAGETKDIIKASRIVNRRKLMRWRVSYQSTKDTNLRIK